MIRKLLSAALMFLMLFLIVGYVTTPVVASDQGPSVTLPPSPPPPPNPPPRVPPNPPRHPGPIPPR
jgi:hypothetical protein